MYYWMSEICMLTEGVLLGCLGEVVSKFNTKVAEVANIISNYIVR